MSIYIYIAWPGVPALRRVRAVAQVKQVKQVKRVISLTTPAVFGSKGIHVLRVRHHVASRHGAGPVCVCVCVRVRVRVCVCIYKRASCVTLSTHTHRGTEIEHINNIQRAKEIDRLGGK
jgi:hypothetical protein